MASRPSTPATPPAATSSAASSATSSATSRAARGSGTGGRRSSARSAVAAINLTKAYGDGEAQVTALDNVSAHFPRGELTAIMGPSGSGKSTLLHCVAGLDRADSGTVLFSDTDLATLTDAELTILRRERIGFVFQAFNLIPTLTARENIVLPLDLGRRSVDREWLDTVVDALDLGDRLRHRPTELSGGQQQRVACARALITRPDVVFADEPTGNLDTYSSSQLLTFLRSAVSDLGQTVVLVTHDAAVAGTADRVLFIRDGRMVQELQQPTEAKVHDEVKRLDASSARSRGETTARTARTARTDSVNDSDNDTNSESDEDNGADPSLDESAAGRPPRRRRHRG